MTLKSIVRSFRKFSRMMMFSTEYIYFKHQKASKEKCKKIFTGSIIIVYSTQNELKIVLDIDSVSEIYSKLSDSE